jgi:hypothetical protein
MAKICKTCGAELVQSTVPALNGEDRGWRARLIDYPVLACPEGHERREAYPDFNTDWSRVLGYQAPDLWLKPRGIFRRHFSCKRCQGPVQTQFQETLQRRIDVPKHPGHSFAVTISGPLLRCEACGHLWVSDRDSSRVFEALADALAHAGIRRL